MEQIRLPRVRAPLSREKLLRLLNGGRILHVVIFLTLEQLTAYRGNWDLFLEMYLIGRLGDVSQTVVRLEGFRPATRGRRETVLVRVACLVDLYESPTVGPPARPAGAPRDLWGPGLQELIDASMEGRAIDLIEDLDQVGESLDSDDSSSSESSDGSTFEDESDEPDFEIESGSDSPDDEDLIDPDQGWR